ncbi:GNAT family N-acetyltransferase [Sporosalibacterium faouarense]|uniref:GNAT family N-acetyltransferase n=1 Tax=Sporosalibacterium faouarense TaxID=516123 RepID=UPI00192AE8B1|nr:GNAT family protein [Sporosalibacterium faouarense]
MVKLVGKKIYLSVLEKEHCKKLWEDFEYDFESKTEPLNIGHSISKSESWFEEIQNDQGKKHVRLGIFIKEDDSVIGDIALQDIDWKNRSCSIGLGFSKKRYRCKGYGTEAVNIIMEYGFNNLGIERITANTLEQNIAAQKSLDKNGFVLEGRERKAVYFAGQKWDKLNYSILREEFNK